MSIHKRIRESLQVGGDGDVDLPEYRCNTCRYRFESDQLPRRVACPDCESDDVKLLSEPEIDADVDLPDGEASADDDGPTDEEAAAIKDLLTTGQYRCQDCREAFDADESEPSCPDCGSDEVEKRFD